MDQLLHKLSCIKHIWPFAKVIVEDEKIRSIWLPTVGIEYEALYQLSSFFGHNRLTISKLQESGRYTFRIQVN